MSNAYRLLLAAALEELELDDAEAVARVLLRALVRQRPGLRLFRPFVFDDGPAVGELRIAQLSDDEMDGAE